MTVGSASNAGKYGSAEEVRRANILEINLDGSGERVFASGLRNPNGMAWQPSTGALWTAVNERDELGDDLVPDYITSVGEDGFYGWPYSYFGQNERPAPERPAARAGGAGDRAGLCVGLTRPLALSQREDRVARAGDALAEPAPLEVGIGLAA